MLTMYAIDQASPAIEQVAGAITQLGQNSRVGGFRLFALGMIFQRVGRTMYDAGKRILGVGQDAVQMAMQFDYSMRLAQTQAQLTNTQFDKLVEGALRVSSKVAASSEEITEGLYDIFSTTDVKYRAALGMVHKLADAATAGGTDVRTATRGVIQIMNAFDMKAKDTTYILDVLFQEARKSAGTWQEVVAAWGNVVSAGKMANQTLQTLAGAVSFLTRRGRTQAQATISVSRALDTLTRATNAQKLKEVLGIDIFDKATGQYKQLNDIITEMSKAMEGMSQKKIGQVMYDIFGAASIQANRFFRLAIPGFEQLNELTDDMSKKDVAGQFKKAWAIMQKAPFIQWQIMMNDLRATMTKLGYAFLPALKQIIGYVQKALHWFNALDDSTKKTIATWTMVAGVFLLVGGKIMMVLGSLFSLASLFVFVTKFSAKAGASIVKTFTGLVLKGNLVLLVIGAIAGAAYLIYKNWDKVGDFFTELWNAIKTAVEEARNALVAAGDVIIAFFKGWYSVLQPVLGLLVKLITPTTVLAAILSTGLYFAFKGLIMLIPIVVTFLGGLYSKFIILMGAVAQFIMSLGGAGLMGALKALPGALVGLVTPMGWVAAAAFALGAAWAWAAMRAARVKQRADEVSQALVSGVRTYQQAYDQMIAETQKPGFFDRYVPELTAMWETVFGKSTDAEKAFALAVQESNQAVWEHVTALRADNVFLSASVYRLIRAAIAQHHWSEAMAIANRAADLQKRAIADASAAITKYSGKAKVSAKEVIQSFNDQLKSLKEQRKNWDILIARGLPQEYAQQLVDSGGNISGTLEMLAGLNDRKFGAIMSKWLESQGVLDTTNNKLLNVGVNLQAIKDQHIDVTANTTQAEAALARVLALLAQIRGEGIPVPVDTHKRTGGYGGGTSPGGHGGHQAGRVTAGGYVQQLTQPLHVHIEPRKATVDEKEIVRELGWWLRTGAW
jgi:TP901 family phage tail tape measure protein